MTESFVVELKPSVFRETAFTRSDFELPATDPPRRTFETPTAADQWANELNERHQDMGQLSIHTPHPNDTSDVDAYLVFHPAQGLWHSD
ncbi:hypothetical protein [Halocatena halophila]|uniref:hypothetical protein n=1 Tax=Halocatena halophila TaxID=2814576 RepID=UPI002ED5C812